MKKREKMKIKKEKRKKEKSEKESATITYLHSVLAPDNFTQAAPPRIQARGMLHFLSRLLLLHFDWHLPTDHASKA
jgi:hypothetical protein